LVLRAVYARRLPPSRDREKGSLENWAIEQTKMLPIKPEAGL
jgi:hypothetical protein